MKKIIKKEIKNYYKALAEKDIDEIDTDYIEDLENCDDLEDMDKIIKKYIF